MLGTDLAALAGSRHEILGVDRQEMDITDPRQCLEFVTKFHPDAVINAAALTQVDYCESHAEEAFLINGQGAGNLAEAAAAADAVAVQYSTDYVFDGLKDGAYVEEDSTNPQSAYGKSKLRGEELVRLRGPGHLIVRTAWLFGKNGVNFIRTIVGLARKGHTLRVVDDQRGSPTYSRDLAAHTLRMVEAGCRGTYHLTNSGSCTWYGLAVYALERAGLKDTEVKPVTTAEFPRPAPRPANSVLANARLEREGFPAMRPWQEAVCEYVPLI